MKQPELVARWAPRVIMGVGMVLLCGGRFVMDNPQFGIDFPGWVYGFGFIVAVIGMVFVTANMGFAMKRGFAAWLTIAAGCAMIIGLCGIVIVPGPWPVFLAALGAALFALGLMWVKRCPVFAGENENANK